MSGTDCSATVVAMRLFSERPGYSIFECKPEDIIKVGTKGDSCVLVVVNPEEAEVVLQGTVSILGDSDSVAIKPTFVTLRGALFKGSIMIGWILRGARLDFDMPDGRLASIEEVLRVSGPRKNVKEAKRIIAEAAATRPT